MAKKHSRNLELTIISGEDLSLAGSKRPVKKNAFVVVKAESNNDQITAINTGNGAYPSWNEKFCIEMPMHVNFFTLEVHCKNFSGDRVVGSARVPASDFTGGYFSGNHLHFLSYRLRDRYGDRNGIINISVKVKSPENGAGNGSTGALPSGGWNYGVAVDQKVSGGVVIGVPVRQRY